MQSRHSATRANCLSIVTRLPPIAGFVIISALASSSGHPLFGQSADTTPPAVWITAVSG